MAFHLVSHQPSKMSYIFLAPFHSESFLATLPTLSLYLFDYITLVIPFYVPSPASLSLCPSLRVFLSLLFSLPPSLRITPFFPPSSSSISFSLYPLSWTTNTFSFSLFLTLTHSPTPLSPFPTLSPFPSLPIFFFPPSISIPPHSISLSLSIYLSISPSLLYSLLYLP